jgi:cytochrome c-type biogenesis protein
VAPPRWLERCAKNLPQTAATTVDFGIGAALPLLLLGFLSREASIVSWRHRFMGAGQFTKAGLGILFVAIGALVITGPDKSIETVLVAASPQWLTDLTIRS